MQEISKTLAGNSQHINNILMNTDKMSNQFTPFMQSSISAVKTLESQTLPAANQAMLNFEIVMRNLAQVSAEIKQNPAVLIRGKGQQKLGPGEN